MRGPSRIPAFKLLVAVLAASRDVHACRVESTTGGPSVDFINWQNDPSSSPGFVFESNLNVVSTSDGMLELDVASNTLTCKSVAGSCQDAVISGCSKVICDDRACRAAQISTNRIECRGEGSCVQVTVTGDAQDARTNDLHAICSGRHSCGMAQIHRPTDVECGLLACYKTDLIDLPDGAKVRCDGDGSCRIFSIAVETEDESDDVEVTCRGEWACSGLQSSGMNLGMGRITCTGSDACYGVTVHAGCLDCRDAQACTGKCLFHNSDCRLGQLQGPNCPVMASLRAKSIVLTVE